MYAMLLNTVNRVPDFAADCKSATIDYHVRIANPHKRRYSPTT